jgi:hypothetical protein
MVAADMLHNTEQDIQECVKSIFTGTYWKIPFSKQNYGKTNDSERTSSTNLQSVCRQWHATNKENYPNHTTVKTAVIEFFNFTKNPHDRK